VTTREPMRDKVAILIDETGCERGEAELALQLCGYDVQAAVQAVPRLFQNIGIFKGRFCARSESLYGLWIAILNLREKRLLRARAVISYNPAVFATELDQHWFDFEARLYACRLWAGSLQPLSQEVEGVLADLFDSKEARGFYGEDPVEETEFQELERLLARRLGGTVDLEVQQDVLDMGQFQEVVARGETEAVPEPAKPRPRRTQTGAGAEPLILQIAVEPDAEGISAGELSSGDHIPVTINDTRDIGRYLAKLLGSTGEEGGAPLLAPVEAIELGANEVLVRVRFSAGVCGDVALPPDLRVRVERKPAGTPWWKKIFGG